MTPRHPLRGLALILIAACAAPAAADPIHEILNSGALKSAYNPVLLDYLLEEGARTLPAEQRQTAVDQLVTALKQDLERSREERAGAAMATAGAALAELLGGSDVRAAGSDVQSSMHRIWSGWVDSAFTLQKAGYAAEADAFFEDCVETFPYPDLQGRCAVGLAAGRPAEAVELLLALTADRGADAAVVNATLPLLGDLAARDGLPEAQKAAILDRFTELTQGLQKASHGVAACRGLVRAGDPRAVPTLTRLGKGLMNAEIHPCARRGLLLTFDDRSVVPLLEKQLKGGSFSTTEPHERLAAAGLLMEAGEDAGFAWATGELTRKPKKGFKKLMKTTPEVDLKPQTVRLLVAAGGDRALAVLRQGFAAAETGSWIRTWTALGMLELGDAAHVDLVRQALANPEWEFTVVRAATALAEHGDDSGVGALETLYGKAAAGQLPGAGKTAMAWLSGRTGDQERRQAELVRLRRQIADALATIDGGGAAAVLARVLGDGDASVRMAAAYALTRMSDPAAAGALARALAVDYGSFAGGASANPVVHARIVRRAAARFPGAEGTPAVLEAAGRSPFKSVGFLALCAGNAAGDGEPHAAAG